MTQSAAKSSQSPCPPCSRVLGAYCTRQFGAADTRLRVHLDAGQVIEFSFTLALASSLGLRPVVLGAPAENKGVATGQGRRADPARTAALRTAWHRYIADPKLQQGALAAELGVSSSTISQYFRRFAKEPGAPLLRSNGKLSAHHATSY